jgi:outer membrane protein assembly factor BamB
MDRNLFIAPTIQLEVRLDKENNFVWIGDYNGIPIIQAAIMTKGECILLLDYENCSADFLENLICINESGKIIWKSKLSNSSDFFVELNIAKETIYANTWNGYLLQIDPRDGSVLKCEFVK